MSDHLNELPPTATLLGREVIAVDAQTGEIRLKFLARADFPIGTEP